ncbi:MAG: hypothetical protein A2V81_03295 [Candidatus Abawacabacteria bacterium RBG_16_42_10]|uniref:Guanylate kinase-like domain-containing protein n=1 Tax=Candidatus Abawacabacteria bacterium RBG_16_42_10 TaxID=1817814 RepID=A0A1F4XJM0_9BACT|nr:MAG: hypothetical protein A2V81_03295 [Candidatus Abawacabacteria bacterium RBG_16_42_10]
MLEHMRETVFVPESITKTLRAQYLPQVVNAVLTNANYIKGLQEKWNQLVHGLAKAFSVDVKDMDEEVLLREIERVSLVRIQDFIGNSKNVVMGIVGPGGAGKGTVKGEVSSALDATTIINSTTRDRRPSETDGVHYHFITGEKIAAGAVLGDVARKQIAEDLGISSVEARIDDKVLEMLESVGEKKGEYYIPLDIAASDCKYVTLMYRSGRGWYGVSKESIDATGKDRFVFMEENINNLREVSRYLRSSNDVARFFVVCVLPPQPIAFHSAARAYVRDGADMPLEKLQSTIGPRQMREFEDLLKYIKEVPMVFLANDDLIDIDGKKQTRVGQELIKALRQ